MLDIAPAELSEEEKRKGLTLQDPRCAIASCSAGLEAAKKSRPAAFFTPETARLITPGNFEDNLGWCGEVDWIVEAVAENLEIKRKLFERVEAVRKPGTIVTLEHLRTADSSDRRRTLRGFPAALGGNAFFQSAALHEAGGADRRDRKRARMCWRRLREICDLRLGKGVVPAKDTPNFIANRIGTFSMLNSHPCRCRRWT